MSQTLLKGFTDIFMTFLSQVGEPRLQGFTWFSQILHKHVSGQRGGGAHTHIPSIWKMESGESEVQGQLDLYILKFQAKVT